MVVTGFGEDIERKVTGFSEEEKVTEEKQVRWMRKQTRCFSISFLKLPGRVLTKSCE